MTKNEALTLALAWYDSGSEVREEFQEMIESILAQPQEANNFCPRCGKRTPDPEAIHTCTPPRGLELT